MKFVQAPMANNQPPGFAALVCAAGAVGSVAAAALSADELRAEIRAMPDTFFTVNLFAPPFLRDDALQVVLDERPPVFSFTFGIGDPAPLRDAGIEVWGTATSADEARALRDAGVDVVVAQGAEAGGHRGSFAGGDAAGQLGILAVTQLLVAQGGPPVVASGGLMTGGAVAAVLAAGARAAQLGSAFLLTPEAGTSPPHRDAVATPAPTALTRAFSGRLARGIENRFLLEHSASAPPAYPEVHHITTPLRAHGRKTGDGDVVNLWAGQAHELARAEPAGEIVRRIAAEALQALARARSHLSP